METTHDIVAAEATYSALLNDPRRPLSRFVEASLAYGRMLSEPDPARSAEVLSLALIGSVLFLSVAMTALMIGSAWNGAVPAGVQPLPIDIFTSKDFYKDRELWKDKRYFRCNSPQGLELQRGAICARRCLHGGRGAGRGVVRRLDFAHHRQLFLTEQGYSYSIVDASELMPVVSAE